MQIKISADDYRLLQPLLPPAPSGDFRYRFAGDTLTVADAYADAVRKIVDDPKWKARAVKDSLRQRAAEKRATMDVAGANFLGHAVATDRDTVARIVALDALVQTTPRDITWKFDDGTFQVLDATQMHQLAQAVGAHIARCLEIERAVNAKIENGAIATTDQVDAAFA